MADRSRTHGASRETGEPFFRAARSGSVSGGGRGEGRHSLSAFRNSYKVNIKSYAYRYDNAASFLSGGVVLCAAGRTNRGRYRGTRDILP